MLGSIFATLCSISLSYLKSKTSRYEWTDLLRGVTSEIRNGEVPEGVGERDDYIIALSTNIICAV
jgi:hypothetical protein